MKRLLFAAVLGGLFVLAVANQNTTAPPPAAFERKLLSKEQLGNITPDQMKTMRAKIQLAERTNAWPSPEVRAFVLLCLTHSYMDHCTSWRQ